MKALGEIRLLRWIAVMAVVFYPLCGWPIIAVGETVPGPVKPTTSFTHRVPDHFVSGHRIELTAGIRDKEGIDLARCYFKASEQADFVFVEMVEIKGNDYRAVLPAPAEGTGRIDYFFLARNQAGAVTRTQEFYLFQSEREEVPGWQEVDAAEPLTVKTELAEAPEDLAGFSDSIEMDTVESAARLVVVAGGVGGITMVTAGSGGGTILGMSVTTAAIVGGGAAAAGAGAAVAASSGGGGGGGSSGDKADPYQWSSWAVPANPAPYQDVIIYVNVNRPGVEVHYEVHGTDDYYDRGQMISGSNGQISFSIPGADPGVRDTVRVWVPSWGSSYTRTWSYVF